MPYSILIVDPDSMFREGLVQALAGSGFKTIQADSLEDESLDTFSPNILVASFDELPQKLPEACFRTTIKDSAIVLLSKKEPSSADFSRLLENERIHAIFTRTNSAQGVAEFLKCEYAHLERKKKQALRERLSKAIDKEKLSIASRLAELQCLLKESRSDQSNALSQAINIAHMLKGTAATFGFPHTGEIAGQLEALLQGLSTQADTDASWEKITTLAEAAAASLNTESRKTETQKPVSSKFDIDGIKVSEDRSGENRESYLARILLIDDDEIFSEYLRKIGRQRLIEVIAVTGLEEAAINLKYRPFDAVVVDLNLGPGIDACKGIVNIREEASITSLPMAFISASGTPEERSRATAAGAVLFLNKPLEPENFEAAVQQMLSIGNKSGYRVLSIDDDLLFLSVLDEMLNRHKFETAEAHSGEDILTILDEVNPDILLLDLNLPVLNGFDLCKLLRATPRWQSLPIILMTSQSDWQTRVLAFQAGFDDYISKPLIEEELIAKVQGRIERAKVLSDRSKRDPITGVYTRTAFIEELQQMLRRCKTEDKSVSLAILDLDTFKKVNDLGGHLTGDSVLASLGRTLMSNFRCIDLRGRWGGDEFIIALEGSDKDEAAKLLQGLLKSFCGIEFRSNKNETFKMSFSAGVAQFPQEGSSCYDLLSIADERLYHSKAKGRSRISNGNLILGADP